MCNNDQIELSRLEYNVRYWRHNQLNSLDSLVMQSFISDVTMLFIDVFWVAAERSEYNRGEEFHVCCIIEFLN